MGVYADRDTAIAIQSSLIGRIKNNVIVVSDTSNADQVLHKVRIGPIRTLKQLEETQDTLISESLPHYFLMTEAH